MHVTCTDDSKGVCKLYLQEIHLYHLTRSTSIHFRKGRFREITVHLLKCFTLLLLNYLESRLCFMKEFSSQRKLGTLFLTISCDCDYIVIVILYLVNFNFRSQNFNFFPVLHLTIVTLYLLIETLFFYSLNWICSIYWFIVISLYFTLYFLQLWFCDFEQLPYCILLLILRG